MSSPTKSIAELAYYFGDTPLESWGYSVITAGSYDETLRKVVTRPERPGADHLRLSLAR